MTELTEYTEYTEYIEFTKFEWIKSHFSTILLHTIPTFEPEFSILGADIVILRKMRLLMLLPFGNGQVMMIVLKKISACYIPCMLLMHAQMRWVVTTSTLHPDNEENQTKGFPHMILAMKHVIGDW